MDVSIELVISQQWETEWWFVSQANRVDKLDRIFDKKKENLRNLNIESFLWIKFRIVLTKKIVSFKTSKHKWRYPN